MFSLIIVGFHARNFANNEEPILKGGYIGVEFFFIVSGLLMANSAEKRRETNDTLSLGKDTYLFMKKKILGLMPNIYIAWIIAFFVEHIGNFSVKPMLKELFYSISELLFITESGFLNYSVGAGFWYISAMLIAMFILYPLMRKYKDIFFYIIAPLLCIFLLGYSFQTWNSFSGPRTWLGYCNKGVIRALLGILIGCICYKIGSVLKNRQYTSLTRYLLTVMELAGYGVLLFLIWVRNGGGRTDWYLLLLMPIPIICSFSQISMLEDVFSRYRIFHWLGEFSFALYLSHIHWSHKMTILMPESGYYQRFPVYLLLVTATGLFVMYVSKLLVYIYKKIKERYGKQIKSWFIAA